MINIFKAPFSVRLNDYFFEDDGVIYPVKKGYIIEFAKKFSIQRYQPNMSMTQMVNFRRIIDILYQQLIFMVKSTEFKDVFIMSYDKRWGFKTDSGSEYVIDKEKMINTDEDIILKKILIMSLLYKTFPVFINSGLKIAIITTDHCDLFVSGDYDGFLYSNSSGLAIKAWN